MNFTLKSKVRSKSINLGLIKVLNQNEKRCSRVGAKVQN